MSEDLVLLDVIRQHYLYISLEEAHDNLADIVYDGEVADEHSYDNCFPEGDYVMPEQMREFAENLDTEEGDYAGDFDD